MWTDGDNIMMQVAPGTIAIFMSRYDNISKTGYRFSLEKFQDKKLASRLTSLTCEAGIHFISGRCATM